jgi:hypothetical protein
MTTITTNQVLTLFYFIPALCRFISLVYVLVIYELEEPRTVEPNRGYDCKYLYFSRARWGISKIVITNPFLFLLEKACLSFTPFFFNP